MGLDNSTLPVYSGCYYGVREALVVEGSHILGLGWSLLWPAVWSCCLVTMGEGSESCLWGVVYA